MLVIKKAIAARHLQVKFNTIVIAEVKIKEVYRKLELQLPWDSASPSPPSSSPPPTGCWPSTSSSSSKESNLHLSWQVRHQLPLNLMLVHWHFQMWNLVKWHLYLFVYLIILSSCAFARICICIFISISICICICIFFFLYLHLYFLQQRPHPVLLPLAEGGEVAIFYLYLPPWTFDCKPSSFHWWWWRFCRKRILIAKDNQRWETLANTMTDLLANFKVKVRLQFIEIKYCETQPQASIGWVALFSVVRCRLSCIGNISSHLHYMMFLSIQTIYFLWGYDPGNMSVSTYLLVLSWAQFTVV